MYQLAMHTKQPKLYPLHISNTWTENNSLTINTPENRLPGTSPK